MSSLPRLRSFGPLGGETPVTIPKPSQEERCTHRQHPELPAPRCRGWLASLALTHPRGALPSPSLQSPAVASAADSSGWTLRLQPVPGEQLSNPRWRLPAPLPQTLSRLPEALAGEAAAEGAWQQACSRRGVAAQLVALKDPQRWAACAPRKPE